MRIVALMVVLLLSASASRSQATAPSSEASKAAQAPLPQDKHGGLAISVDAYTNADRAREKFGKSADPIPAGILPIEVLFTNETPRPLRVDLETVQLEVQLEGSKQQLDWLSIRRVATLIVHPSGTPSAPSERRFPVGIPTPSKDKKVDKIAADLRPFVLDSDVIPPLGRVHGFLFFNVNHDFESALASSLYVPDVVILPDKTPLMFFEVPLTRKP